jgi:YegS/Rv2252/BmrU family lipid kinase
VRTCVIFNPTARGEKAKRFRRHLTEVGAQSTLKLTTGPGDARRLATEAVAEGFDTVVAAGGDGTVNEVLNGIVDHPEGCHRARLGVLPLGTVNVFARELGLCSQFALAWETIRRGHETVIDLPSVEYGTPGARQRRCFAQLAGAGLDARAIELVEWELKKKFGPLAYVWAGLQALTGSPSEITAADSHQSATGGLVLIGNGRLYGGQFRVFPKADLRDGLLDICVFPRLGWTTLAQCSLPLLLRGELPASAVQAFRASTFTLTSPMPTPLEVDGELIGHLPATFYVNPASLRVIVPA